MAEDFSRRSFLKKAAALSAGIAMSGLITNSSTANAATPQGKFVKDRKVNLAAVGIAQQGKWGLMGHNKTGLCNVVAICDTDLGTERTKVIEDMFPNARRFRDFREMFKEMADEIDAVTIGVPDHSHFPITMAAMKLGKHVYVEKPLARTFQECELMMAAEKKYGVVTQMGNQGHSGDNYYQFRALEKAGVIKDVTAITAHMNNNRRWHSWDPKMQSFPAAETIPSTLDWDTWLGVVHHHDYNKDYVVGQWRCWFDFGMGALGDWGAHIIDTAHQFLELGLPYEVNPTYLKDHNPFFYPMSTTLEFKFPERGERPPVVITWKDGLDNLPELPEGYGVSTLADDIPEADGAAVKETKINPGKEIYTESGLVFKGGSHGTKLELVQNSAGKAYGPLSEDWEHDMPTHQGNFLLACQGKCEPTSPFSVSGPLSQVFCLGVLAQRFGTKILFDRETKRITNNPLADIMLRGDAPRPGWEEYYEV